MTTGFTIGGTPVPVPSGIPTGGLAENQVLIQNILAFFMFIAVTLTIFFLIWGGILWITSGGDKTKLQAARNRIIYAIIGLVIVFLSFLIVNIIGFLFGVNLLSITPPGT